MSFTRRYILAILGLLLLGVSNTAGAAVTDLLFVVGNSGALTAGESTRKSGFETYGYTVTLIDDGASQATFNTMAAANNIAWVSPDVSSATLNTKLKNVTIGVIVEHVDLADDFGFCTSGYGVHSKNFLVVQNNTHYITSGFSLGNLTILSSLQPLARRTGTMAAGAVNLASTENIPGQTGPGLIVMDVGAALSGGGTAAGRRVLLPVGSSLFNLSALNSNGMLLFLRSIEWAARPNPSLGTMLMPVGNPGALTTQETLRRMQIDVWGYDVTLIDDGATQASYTAAYAGKDAVYVSEEVVSASLTNKLLNCPLGVVNEKPDLGDELGLASAGANPAATQVTIAENSHYITSEFPVGLLTIFSSSQSAGTISGTTAPGMQTLGTIGGVKALAIVEAGGVLTTGTTAAGRRVQLPWGGSTFDFNALNSSGRELMRRSIEWAAASVGTRVLLVVKDANALSTQELARKTLLESWGYSLNIIDDDATQASYNLAIASNTVAYVTEEILSSSLGTKLRAAPIGVVNEEAFAVGQFGLASGQSLTTQSSLSVLDGTHYITRTLGSGSFTLFTSGQPVTSLTGTSSSLKVLGQWGSAPALATLEAGARMTDGTSVAGRRVQLPWGDTAFNFTTLNANGQTILQRSLQWASGLIGYWRLDENSGTLASDSSGYSHHGTLGGSMNFSSATITPARLNSGANFNGSTNYVAVTSTSTLQPTGALSIAAWIKGDSWSSGTYVNNMLRKGDDNPNNYQLAISGGRLEGLLNGNDNSGFKGNTVLQAGRWYHVAMTWDGNSVRLYVDGVPDNNPPPTRNTPIGSDSRPLYIGGRAGSTDCFDGVLDEVRLYNYALSASEVEAARGIAPLGVRVIKWREIR